MWALILLICCATARGSVFRDGDIVPTSRRAQFHGSRTTWHDVVGQFCPRFGMDRLVAIPLPRPIGYETADEYKIMLSFDHDRHLTAWIPIVSKRIKFVPMLDVVLTHTGPQLTAVAAKVQAVPEHYLQEKPMLASEFADDTTWPKHLLVYYRWEARQQLNQHLGLYVLLLAGLSMVALLLISVISTFGDKLEQFVADVAGDEGRDGYNNNGNETTDVTPFGAPPMAQSMGMGRQPMPPGIPPRVPSLGPVFSGGARPPPHSAKAD